MVRLPPTRSNLRFLQNPQHLGLGFQAHVADFVEKQSSFVGQVEFPAALRRGPGKRAFFVAEQFGFNEILGMAAQLTSMNGLSPRKDRV